MNNPIFRPGRSSAWARQISLKELEPISYASAIGENFISTAGWSRQALQEPSDSQTKSPGATAKRVLDYSVGGLAILLASPFLLGIAVAVKLDSPGPVFFSQPRRGLHNRLFTAFKFRTMQHHLSDIDASQQTSRDDPRVTRVGKWLRRLSLDELPQLINVLRGEMSLVGPRPHAPHTRVEGELLQVASSSYLFRYSVKPGITGWAQINGARGELVAREDLRKRIDLDLEYIERQSFWFDLKILILTAKREIISKNAY